MRVHSGFIKFRWFGSGQLTWHTPGDRGATQLPHEWVLSMSNGLYTKDAKIFVPEGWLDDDIKAALVDTTDYTVNLNTKVSF